MKKTYQPTKQEIKREWHLIDAKNKVLGRLCSEVAKLLIGKQKVSYAPHFDTGDHVVVINAKKIKVTGRKMKQKKYYRHSGYPQGFRELTLQQQLDKDPRKVIELAVKRMLPKNRLQDQRMRRLRVFIKDKHDYEDKLKAKSNGQIKSKKKVKEKETKSKTQKDSKGKSQKASKK